MNEIARYRPFGQLCIVSFGMHGWSFFNSLSVEVISLEDWDAANYTIPDRGGERSACFSHRYIIIFVKEHVVFRLPGRTRTCNLPVRSRMRSPVSLQGVVISVCFDIVPRRRSEAMSTLPLFSYSLISSPPGRNKFPAHISDPTWKIRYSKPWPPACKAGAFPTKLISQNKNRLFLIWSRYKRFQNSW